jgi:hypothetical protein
MSKALNTFPSLYHAKVMPDTSQQNEVKLFVLGTKGI